jgi:hypothetical protein
MPVHGENIPLLVFYGLLCAGCSNPDGASTGTPLPPADTSDISYIDEDSWADTDTGLSGAYPNEAPPHTLTMTHTGSWDLLPISGPFTSMVGELQILEALDSEPLTPWCKATFSLTGQSADERCPTCDFGFIILFYLNDEGDKKNKDVGGLEDCQSPGLPADGEVRTLAYSESDSMIYLNYYDTGIWVPWYEANQLRDELNYAWTGSAGFIGVEEEEE